MSVVDLLLRLQSLGLAIAADGEKLRITGATERLTPELRTDLSAAKADLLAFLRTSAVSAADRIPRVDADAGAPLSYTQQRFWFFHSLVPDTSAYHVCFGLRMQGTIDRPVVSRAIDEIVRRHAVLRSVFFAEDGRPMQRAMPPAPVPLPGIDLSDVAEDDERGARLQAVAREIATRPFDLAADRPMRVALVRLAADDHVLIVVTHHIASDAWSVTAFIREFGALYEAFSEGRPSPLPELAVQYSDYAAWQRSAGAAGFESERAYWKGKLADAPALQLPSDRTRPPFQTFRGGRAAFSLPAALVESLDTVARSERATLFMVLLAGFYALLQRYAGQTDLVVGTAIAGRRRPELEPLIGPFINSLALRTSVGGDPTFRAIVARTRETALEAYANQDVPFEQIVDDLHLDRALSRNPLFQVMLALQNVPPARLDVRGLRLSAFDIDRSTTVSDLELIFWPTGAALEGYVRYSADMFDGPTIERLLAHYRVLLEGAAANPACPLSRLPLLTADDRRALDEWNATRREFAAAIPVHEAFEAQARRTPARPAIVSNGISVSYRDADASANALAHRLAAAGVQREERVALLLERSIEFVVSALGILKAGAAYLPIDPSTPVERLAYMVRDAGVRFVVTTGDLERRVVDCGAVPIATSDASIAADAPRRAVRVAPGDLAYVIYTSGSTGRPKGVGVPHRALQNLIAWHQRVYRVEADDRASLVAGLGFDASVWEIWPYLTSGACLCVPDEETRESAAALLEWIAQMGVTLAFVPTPLAEALFDLPMPAGLRLRSLLTGGDTLHRVPAGLPFAVYNNYGPTENTVVASWTEVAGGTEQPPSIGGPVDNARLHVLDARMERVPRGVPGELYIAGESLARGYLGQPALTADRFVPDPFAAEPGGRLYRTGDLVRRAASGGLDFLGRLDDQVKVRGFRIELGEIEAVLAQHPAVREAVVLAREGRAGNRRLVAYATCRSAALDTGDVTRFLKSRLADYMIPSAIVALPAFPLTPNGKVDRAALPEPAVAADRAAARPMTLVERQLADIWGRVLRLDAVSSDDNFFEVGGDSILALQVISAARQQGLRLTPRQIFEHPTVAELAAVAVVDRRSESLDEPAVGEVPLTPIQRWFFDRRSPEPHHFNQSLVLTASAPIDRDVLQRTLDRLVAHHAALRLRFVQTPDGWRQSYGPAGEAVPVEWIDLGTNLRGDGERAASAAADRVQASLDLEHGPLFRAAVFSGVGGPQRILLTAHHLVVDTVSWRILVEDFSELYRAFSSEGDAVLAPASASFKTWAELVTRDASSAEVRAELDFWRHAAQPSEALPRDLAGSNTYDTAGSVTVRVAADQTDALVHLIPRSHGTQPHELLLAAVARAVSTWTGRRRVPFSLESHGRDALSDDVDLSRTVGWFTSLYPLTIDLRAAESDAALVAAVKQQTRAVPHRGAGFGALRYAAPDDMRSALADLPSPEISFNYLGQFAAAAADAMFVPAAGPTGAINSPRMPRPHVLEVSALISGDLRITVHYSTAVHRRTTIAALAGAIAAEVSGLIAHCRAAEPAGFVPSDFPEADVSQEDLDRLLAQLGQGG